MKKGRWKDLVLEDVGEDLEEIAGEALEEKESKIGAIIDRLNEAEEELERVGVSLSGLEYHPEFLDYYALPGSGQRKKRYNLFWSAEPDGYIYHLMIHLPEEEEAELSIYRESSDQVERLEGEAWKLETQDQKVIRRMFWKDMKRVRIEEEAEAEEAEAEAEDFEEYEEEDALEEEAGFYGIPLLVEDLLDDADLLEELVAHRRDLVLELLEDAIEVLKKNQIQTVGAWMDRSSLGRFLGTALTLVEPYEDWHLFRIGEYDVCLTLDEDLPEDGGLYGYVENPEGERYWIPKVYLVGED